MEDPITCSAGLEAYLGPIVRGADNKASLRDKLVDGELPLLLRLKTAWLYKLISEPPLANSLFTGVNACEHIIARTKLVPMYLQLLRRIDWVEVAHRLNRSYTKERADMIPAEILMARQITLVSKSHAAFAHHTGVRTRTLLAPVRAKHLPAECVGTLCTWSQYVLMHCHVYAVVV